MFSPNSLKSAGLIPIKEGPVRFAVGSPYGLTSNAWRVWSSNAGDVYIACRDNFKTSKVSLHVSGRWRMAFTSEAVENNPALVADGQDRAWEVWDRPPEIIPDMVRAFQLIFPTPQLLLSPDQRPQKKWKDVVYIEAAPPGKLTVLTLFITRGEPTLAHESEPSFCLASLKLGENLYGQLVAHGESERGFPELVADTVEKTLHQTKVSGVTVPESAYGYFFGHHDDGTRFIFSAALTQESDHNG